MRPLLMPALAEAFRAGHLMAGRAEGHVPAGEPTTHPTHGAQNGGLPHQHGMGVNPATDDATCRPSRSNPVDTV